MAVLQGCALSWLSWRALPGQVRAVTCWWHAGAVAAAVHRRRHARRAAEPHAKPLRAAHACCSIAEVPARLGLRPAWRVLRTVFVWAAPRESARGPPAAGLCAAAAARPGPVHKGAHRDASLQASLLACVFLTLFRGGPPSGPASRGQGAGVQRPSDPGARPSCWPLPMSGARPAVMTGGVLHTCGVIGCSP